LKKFIKGKELSRLFYFKEVKPILDRYFPDLKYAAGLLGWGSEVLGFDTVMSTDHNWGPRLQLLLPENRMYLKDKIDVKLSEMLPYTFMGYSTNFKRYKNTTKPTTRLPEIKKAGKIDHFVQIYGIREFFIKHVNFDPYKEIKSVDWLQFPEQRLLTIKEGSIFHDDIGLNKIKTKFDYYPKDIWLYMLASQWKRISQEEAFIGRTASVGDELGSRIIAARMVQELMKLCFLMERKYAPYSKWFGTAFQKLKSSKRLTKILEAVIASKSFRERENNLSKAYEEVARMHNKSGITKKLSAKVSGFHDRPFKVIDAERFTNMILKEIKDRDIRRLKPIGGVDQFISSTDLLEDAELIEKLKGLYL
jgi:hypothetical protein